MGKHLRFAGKGLLFIFILSLCIGVMNRALVKKQIERGNATTISCRAFYQLEKDTVDVVFLGTSHAMNTYIPQELYEQYGICSYNLGSSAQSLVMSYFWLEEALRYQQPQVVILDTFYLYQVGGNNLAESWVRVSLDPMRWSPVKWQAVETVCRLDDTMGSALSYYLPIIRFHTRWKDLGEKDFQTFFPSKGYSDTKGYQMLCQYCGIKEYLPFRVEGEIGEENMLPVMREYLDRIEKLCRENSIKLILTQTPLNSREFDRKQKEYNATALYAKEHGLLYLDFNEKSLYEKIGYDFEKDNADSGHVNLWGAQKITDYIGQVLTQQYGLTGGGEVIPSMKNQETFIEKCRRTQL